MRLSSEALNDKSSADSLNSSKILSYGTKRDLEKRLVQAKKTQAENLKKM